MTKSKQAEEPPRVYYCPRSCHRYRTYPSLAAVIEHVEGQHPDHDPNWWVGGPDDPKVVPA